MRIDVERLWIEQGKEETKVSLPEFCSENEYVLMPGIVQDSLMMLTKEQFEAFQNTCMQSSSQGMRIARMFLMNAYFAEVEEGCVLLPESLLRRLNVKSDFIWLIQEEVGRYHLTAKAALEDVVNYLERKQNKE